MLERFFLIWLHHHTSLLDALAALVSDKYSWKMVLSLAWKVVLVAFAKKATVYALGRVSQWARVHRCIKLSL